MKEYLITVSSDVKKHYLIDASSNEEAISIAVDYFMDGVQELEISSPKISNLKVSIESTGEVDEEELNEKN